MSEKQDDTVMKSDGDDASLAYSSVDADECVSDTDGPTDPENQYNSSSDDNDGTQKGTTEKTTNAWMSSRFAKWGVVGLVVVALCALLIALKKDDGEGANNLDAINETPSIPVTPATIPPTATPTSLPAVFLPTSVPTTNPELDSTLSPSELLPTSTPTIAPTYVQPTGLPTLRPTTAHPTLFPTETLAPTSSQLQQLQTILSTITKNPDALSDQGSSEFLAMKWLYDTTTKDNATVSFNNLVNNRKRLQQRFAIAVLDLAIQGQGKQTPKFAQYRNNNPLDECSWVGVSCTNRTIVKIVWAGDRSLQGHLPKDLGLLTGLDHLDLAENNIRSALPAELNNLAKLRYLYLHDNRLTGPISQDISKLNRLIKLYLGDNQLTGSLPGELRNAQQLRFLQLGRNKLNGPIPNNLNLKILYFLDLSHNRFSGEIPADWYQGAKNLHWLRHLYLNNNNLSGEIPEKFTRIGAGRLLQLDVSSNIFTGIFPGSWDPRNMLEQLVIHSNNFTSVHPQVCWLSVFIMGEMTAYRSDCPHCYCGWPKCETRICI